MRIYEIPLTHTTDESSSEIEILQTSNPEQGIKIGGESLVQQLTVKLS